MDEKEEYIRHDLKEMRERLEAKGFKQETIEGALLVRKTRIEKNWDEPIHPRLQRVNTAYEKKRDAYLTWKDENFQEIWRCPRTTVIARKTSDHLKGSGSRGRILPAIGVSDVQDVDVVLVWFAAHLQYFLVCLLIWLVKTTFKQERRQSGQ